MKIPARNIRRNITIGFWIHVLTFIFPAIDTNAQDPASNLVVTLTANNILSISPTKEITRSEFDNDWGQFEILIPKALFPIAAPNCKKNIILRMPGVPLNALSRAAKLSARWDLFQSLHAITEQKTKSVKVTLVSGPYMKIDKKGIAKLEYCNAYIKLVDE